MPARGGIIAVELATGRERWRTPFDARGGESSPGTALAGGPMLIGDDVVAANAEGVLFGLKVVSEAVACSVDDEIQITSAPGAIANRLPDFGTDLRNDSVQRRRHLGALHRHVRRGAVDDAAGAGVLSVVAMELRPE